MKITWWDKCPSSQKPPEVLNSSNLIENEDYRVHNVMHPVKQGGFSIICNTKFQNYNEFDESP